MRTGHRRLSVLLALAVAAWMPALLHHSTVTAQHLSPAVPPSASAPPSRPDLSVRITSPLGRIGTPGTVRIVAQIRAATAVALQPVRFLVDGVLVGTAEAGPPYAVAWVDENPFLRREIVVQVNDVEGRSAEDKVVLDPYEIVENTHVSSVLVEASVYDPKGRYVLDLDASHFSLTENGIAQKIDMVRQETIPATFALLVDGSQSMSRRMPFVRQAASRVVSYLKAADRVLVVPFGTSLRAVTGPTDDRQTVSDAIGAIDSAGGTSILDALVEAGRLLEGVNGRRALVLITDGYDENSKTAPQDAIGALKRTEATVYAIGVGGVAGISLKGERFMRELAASTGGRAFFPPTEHALDDVYDTLATDAQNRYLITYTPLNQKADGKWRAIELGTGDAGHVVRSRSGYQAPEPAPIRPSLEFAVTDLQRRYLDITRDDIVVLEDGVEQVVETFQEAVSPVSIVLTLDASGSMKKSVQAVKAAAQSFVDALRPEDSLAIIVFGDKPIVAHAFATRREWSQQAIEQYVPAGGTALYDALWDSLRYLHTMKGRRAVVVMTDGRDEDYAGKAAGSTHTYDDVINLVREAEVTAFPVGIGAQIDRGRLQQLADVSGGTAYFPAAAESLSEQYARVVENLRRRFVLSYTSTHAARDGSWRNVEIRSRRRDVLISARSGYFAPDR